MVFSGQRSVAAQVLGVYTRVVEVERKIRETEEIAERLDALEQASEGGSGFYPRAKTR